MMSCPVFQAAVEEVVTSQLGDERRFSIHTLGTPDRLSLRTCRTNGCIYAIEGNSDILINQVLGSPLAGGIARLFLRILHPSPGHVRLCEMIGPGAASSFAPGRDRAVWVGSCEGVRFRATWWLHPRELCWFLNVRLENTSNRPVRCDAVFVFDIGLATRAQVRNNELFTAQYLDHVAVNHREIGHVLMTRQNLPQGNGTHPWLMQGCLPGARGLSTDGYEVFGVESRGGELGSAALSKEMIGQRVRQSELAYTAIQSADCTLEPIAARAVGTPGASLTFFGHFEADHAEPTSTGDVERIKSIRRWADEMADVPASEISIGPAPQVRGVFQTAESLTADELKSSDIEAIFPGRRRHEERDADGRVLSFFVGDDSRHVVLKAKELIVERPHGHVMRAGKGVLPDAELMSCAFYTAGVFASQMAMGNASLGALLSRVRDPLNLVRCGGMRIFVRTDETERWRLLGVPSAFEMTLSSCRWHYKFGRQRLTVSCTASKREPQFSYDVTIDGHAVDLLITGEISAGPAEYETCPTIQIDREKTTIRVTPDAQSLLGRKQRGIVFEIVAHDRSAVAEIGGDELLVDEPKKRDGQPLPYVAIRTRPVTRFGWSIGGTLGNDANESSTLPQIAADVRLTTVEPTESVEQIQDALVWFARDATVHLSTPRGLEQANGGAWGVRDVCQGAVEFLLSYDRADIVAEILRKLFAQQYDGRWDWPQWFMFPPFEQIQSPHAHGDVLIWPLKALCDYLEESNDDALLSERLSYTNPTTFAPTERAETILQHVDRLLDGMRQDFLPGLSLPRFGDGDWDDSLQPADPQLRARTVSSWTVELMYQTLRRYSAAMAHFGDGDRAAAAAALADSIAADFQRYLVPGGVVAGFALFHGNPPRPTECLLHPSDTRTGIHYRLIPMTRGILSGIFSAEQANHHLDLIHKHLLFPDGARLMDRPTTYHGGEERVFHRSESAAFFGREIGLQYVHAHLRYAEALAMMGRGDELWHAVRVVNPIAVTQVVPNARLRQRNCYFSSSDAAFADRYEASRDFEKLRRGDVPVDGGWRIYSSGPGIYTNIVIRHLLGVRRCFESIEFDPVLPRELDGICCQTTWSGRRMRFQFVARGASSPRRIVVNGQPLPGLLSVTHPYRTGGVRAARAAFDAATTKTRVNLVEVQI
jgi:cellobiose phosphorylase